MLRHGLIGCEENIRPGLSTEHWAAFIPSASGDLLCEVKFAKNVLLNLAGCGLRKLVDEPPDTRDLVRGQAFSTKLRQFLLGDLMPRLGLDKSNGHFAPVAVRNPDDGRSHDGGVGIENVLDLAGIDILAPADDHVLAPALNAAISVLVE